MSASPQAQFSVTTVLQGLALAGILWVGSTLNEVKVAVSLNDYRIQQLEAKQ